MNKEIEGIRIQIAQLKALKGQRKACRDAAKVGGDDATLATGVMKLEEWFGKQYPTLDVHSDKAINTALREARNALKVAEAPLDDPRKAKKRRRALIDTSLIGDGDATPVHPKDRRETTTVRRTPARMYAHKA